MVSSKAVRWIARLALAALACVLLALGAYCLIPTRPQLASNPREDVVATNTRPLLSFFNARRGLGGRAYTIQIDKTAAFDSRDLVEYANVPEEAPYVTCKRVAEEDALDDRTRYHWRVRAVGRLGVPGRWVRSRFFLDTASDDAFMGLTRIAVADVKASSGGDAERIIDATDAGARTSWRGAGGAGPEWVEFDLGEPREVARVWMLSNPRGPEGRLREFVWQLSADAKTWRDIPASRARDNDTYRNILDIPPVRARHFRLLIRRWHGEAPQLNAITLYAPGAPPAPAAPRGPYVLIVGNQRDGGTFADLAERAREWAPGLATLTVPHHEVSLAMLERLERKPVAILLSGNAADYHTLPMFEFNGEFEIIRESEIPILGICCGYQLFGMAEGYTFVKHMGWWDNSAAQDPADVTRVGKTVLDPLFDGVPNPFRAPQAHAGEIGVLPEGYEVIAEASCIQVIRHRHRPLYGVQFHPDIPAPYNEAEPFARNFLRMALEAQGEE